MTNTRQTGLLELALDASGGLDRWQRATRVRAWLRMSGPTWTAVGQPTILAGIAVEVDARRQHTVFRDFTGPGRRGVFTPDRVTVEDADGTVLRQRDNPRASYPPRRADTRWDELHALYFAGYAIGNYLTTPYLLTWPGVRTEELTPHQAKGEQWRRLRVSFPPDIAVHCAEQVFYFDESGRQRRVDYAPQVLGDRPAAHITEAHQSVSGLVFPTHRYVLPVQDGQPGPDPTITLDFSDIAVDFAG